MGDFTSVRLGSAGWSRSLSWGASDGGGGGAAEAGGGMHDLLGRREGRAADADAVLAALHFQFRNPGFGRQVDQFTDLIYCHSGLA